MVAAGVCGYVITMLRMESGGGAVEEYDLRYLEVVDNVREMGSSGVIIGDILCLFAYIY